MNTWSIAAVVVTAFALQGPAYAGEALAGQERTACEVILCLSTGSRPSECSPPLSHFFNIRGDDLHETITKRRDFLALCPANGVADSYRALLAQSGQSCQMASLLAYLNRPSNGFGGGPGTRSIPGHCHIYANHEWTDAITLPERQQWCATFSVGRGELPARRCIYRWVDPSLAAPALSDAQVRALIQREWTQQRFAAHAR